jgi:hypothetical protein
MIEFEDRSGAESMNRWTIKSGTESMAMYSSKFMAKSGPESGMESCVKPIIEQSDEGREQ